MIDTWSKIETLFPPCEEAVQSNVANAAPRDLVERAQGCLLGQLAGDSLGSLVEFMDPSAIRRAYPHGVVDLADGGTWNTIAGQPTDDSEMALALARSILANGLYDPAEAAVAYAYWYGSRPFDCGRTVGKALGPAWNALVRENSPAAIAQAARAAADQESQANGALMRVSPLGVYAHSLSPDVCADLARKDAELTHPNPVCRDANAVYAVAIAYAVKTGLSAEEVYAFAVQWARTRGVIGAVLERLEIARDAAPSDYLSRGGWVVVALQNAFWQLLYASSLEAGICDTVMRGGDTDTNAAIAGALLGAVYGASAVPERWKRVILSCRPERGLPGVYRPRPRSFWPVDILTVADRLVLCGLESSRQAEQS
ncbi:MAG: ADP-ribosylglycohydrolase family protein [Thermoleophilia bacterium]|nr:ADP-ribosylglycohydrolase family protein [Thermoleophilia bacterium]